MRLQYIPVPVLYACSNLVEKKATCSGGAHLTTVKHQQWVAVTNTIFNYAAIYICNIKYMHASKNTTKMWLQLITDDFMHCSLKIICLCSTRSVPGYGGFVPRHAVESKPMADEDCLAASMCSTSRRTYRYYHARLVLSHLNVNGCMSC